MLYVLCLLMPSYMPADTKLKNKMSPGTKTAGKKMCVDTKTAGTILHYKCLISFNLIS
jgi:hypothetical protein